MNPFDSVFAKHIRSLAQYNFMNDRMNHVFSSVIKQMNNNPLKSEYLHVTNLMVYDFSKIEEDMFAVDGYGFEGESLISYTEDINDEFCKFLFQNSYEVMLKFVEELALKHYSVKNDMANANIRDVRKSFRADYYSNDLRKGKKYIFEYFNGQCISFFNAESNNYSKLSLINICMSYAEVRNALVHNIEGISQGKFDSLPEGYKDIIISHFSPGAVNKNGTLPVILNKYKTKNLLGFMSSIMFMMYKTCSIDCNFKYSYVKRT